MEDLLKKTGVANSIAAVIFLIMGIILIADPTGVMKAISIVLGIGIIAVGVIKLVMYFKDKENYDFYNYDLIYGILAVVLGIVVMKYGHVIEAVFRLALGIWIIYSGLMRIGLAIKLKAVNAKVWSVGLVLAICMLVGGLYIVFNSGAFIATIGWIVVIYSIMDLIESLIFVKNI